MSIGIIDCYHKKILDITINHYSSSVVAGSRMRLGTIVVLFSMSESWTGLFLYFLNQTLIISLILEESEWKKKKRGGVGGNSRTLAG
jgi:hypothetical protein